MKAKDDSFRNFILDQLGALDRITCRAMFGGFGIYSRATFFGIVSGNRLYFKTDNATRPRYEAQNMKPFQPSATQQLKNYYEVPADIVEDAGTLCEWAYDSIAAANRRRS